MTLALLTPVWIPDVQDLAMMLHADRVILQDTEPFSRKGRVHRARIRTPEGSMWIHIPVQSYSKNSPVTDIRINHDTDWVSSILRVLRLNYRNSIYFDLYEPEIAADLRAGYNMTSLLSFILYTRQRLFSYLDIDINEELASHLDDYDADPDIMAKNAGADRLFQEHDSRHYQRQTNRYETPGFKVPAYRQHFGGFVEGCCLYDLLFECGPEAFKILERLGE